ncbi:MAG: hypothetical protein ACRDQA_06835 [Nocardioidaceae bacterium]
MAFVEHAIRDGNLITGQQQNSGAAAARLVVTHSAAHKKLPLEAPLKISLQGTKLTVCGAH